MINVVGKANISYYAEGVPGLHMVNIVYDFVEERSRTSKEIIDECTRQANPENGRGQWSPEVELRLRKLVAIVLSMKEVGLIE